VGQCVVIDLNVRTIRLTGYVDYRMKRLGLGLGVLYSPLVKCIIKCNAKQGDCSII